MDLKPCTIHDIDTLIKIVTQSYRQHYAYLWYDHGEKYINDQFNFSRIKQQLQNPDTSFFLVSDAQKPVGILKLNDNQPIKQFPPEESLEIERLYLLNKATGKGLGQQVMHYIIKHAQTRRKKVIWLKTMANSKAEKFYRKCGFYVFDRDVVDMENIIENYNDMVVMVYYVNGNLKK